ncbi:MAG: hypothetical protein Tsb0032_35230 [Kiloniellaceae bacterium]
MRRAVRWIAISWFTLAGLLGAGLSGSAAAAERAAEADSRRAALEARLENARNLLGIEEEARKGPGRRLGERLAQWFNWPNWSNWSNWSNWRNW